jgi:signal transduction histidine kinase
VSHDRSLHDRSADKRLRAGRDDLAQAHASPREPWDAYWHAARQLMNLLADEHQPADVVDQIARAAKKASGADGVAVVRASEHGPLRLVASDGVPDEFAVFLRSLLLQDGTISRDAVTGRHPVPVTDLATYPPYGEPPLHPARDAAARAGFTALLSVPLLSSSGGVVGALNLYRGKAHTWDGREISRASDYAEHAAAGILVATNIGEQHREIDALQGFADAHLRESHEYANRLHALSGLLDIDEVDAARGFLKELNTLHHEGAAFVAGRIRNPALAGLVLAQMRIAERQGITLVLDPDSQLAELPHRLTDAAAVTILGNLLANAIEAVAEIDDPGRRRVVLRVDQRPEEVRIIVRDWGAGIDPADVDDILRFGFTRKPGHRGVGVALVSDHVTEAGGGVRIDSHEAGTTITARIPQAD